MECENLAYTGASVLVIAAAGGAFLLLGLLVLVLVRARRRRLALTGFVVLIALFAGMIESSQSPAAQAATSSGCSTSNQTGQNALTLTQTSVIGRLAPGIQPVAITGTIANIGTDNAFISAVIVSIAAVTTTARSGGSCEASDFVLRNPGMPVGRNLGADATTSFAGASIGFNDRSVNQDACKGSTIHLHYETT
jgi:hypothetical protein